MEDDMVITSLSGLYENLKVSGLTTASSSSKTDENGKSSSAYSYISDKAEISALGSFLVNMPEELQKDMADFRNAVKAASESGDEFDAESIAASASEELQTYAEEQGISLAEIAQQGYDNSQKASAEGMYGMKPAGGPPPPPSGAGETEETSAESSILELFRQLQEESETESGNLLSFLAETSSSEDENASDLLLSALEEAAESSDTAGAYELKYSQMMNSLLFKEA